MKDTLFTETEFPTWEGLKRKINGLPFGGKKALAQQLGVSQARISRMLSSGEPSVSRFFEILRCFSIVEEQLKNKQER